LEKSEEFIAINLHHQEFKVGSESYRTTTCGAAAAHTRGFKQNGLWNILNVKVADPIFNGESHVKISLIDHI
jgi:hypothetical protein